MRKKDKLFHSANKKTVASLGLMSYGADGTLVFKDSFVKVYEITNGIKKVIKDSEKKLRFVYVSSDGISIQIFLVVYFNDEDEVEDFEDNHSLTSLDFSALMNLILSIRDQEKEFSMSEYKKQDLKKYLEQSEYEDKFKAIEFLQYPVSCQSELFLMLKKMELAYIFIVEKQDVAKEDLDNILRHMERKYNEKPSIENEYAFGTISLLVFSQDEETLDIGVRSLKEKLTREGFVVDISALNDNDAYEYHTSLGIFSKELDSLITTNVLDAFL